MHLNNYLVLIIEIICLEYCSSRLLRWKMWNANATLLSPSDDKMFQTNSILREIYFMRKQQASLFKYKTYAHMSMITKMADSLEEVYDTFNILLESGKISFLIFYFLVFIFSNIKL